MPTPLVAPDHDTVKLPEGVIIPLALTDVGGSRSYLEILKLANLAVPFEEGGVARATGYAKDILEKEMAEM